MDKSGKTVVVTVIAVAVTLAAVAAVGLYVIIRGVLGFFGYLTPAQRRQYKHKTEKTLEKRYPGHDFDVETFFGSGEYGYYLNITGIDENGIEFRVQWVEGEMEDHYHDEWNEFYYGEKIVEYQNSLRDKYFPQIPYVDTYEYSGEDIYEFTKGPYKEVFFESLDDAIEGSKCWRFDTDVTFKGIDLDTADDEELEEFAGSMADSLMWLYEETGYSDIWVNSYHYHAYDEYGSGFKTKDELVASIIKQVKFDREHK